MDMATNVKIMPSEGIYPYLGERMSYAREYLGLSREESAQKLGLNLVKFCDIEEGREKVSDEILSKISETFNRSINWLTLSQGLPESELAKSFTPLPTDFTYKDLGEFQAFEQVIESMSQSSKESDGLKKLNANLSESNFVDALHQELGTYQSSLDYGYVDIIDAIFRLGVTLIFRPLKGLGSVLSLERTSGVMLSVSRSMNELRFASASALSWLIEIHKLKEKKSQKAWYSLVSESKLCKSDRENLKHSLYLLLPDFLLSELQTKFKWSNTDLTNPVNMYQASLRLGASYALTVKAYLRSNCITISQAKTLLKEDLLGIKRAIIGGYLPYDIEKANVWLLTEKEEGTVIRANQNDVFVIKLKENRSAGYTWDYSELQKEGIVILSDENIRLEERVVGAPSLRSVIASTAMLKDGDYVLEESCPWPRITKKTNKVTIPFRRQPSYRTGLFSSESQNSKSLAV